MKNQEKAVTPTEYAFPATFSFDFANHSLRKTALKIGTTFDTFPREKKGLAAHLLSGCLSHSIRIKWTWDGGLMCPDVGSYI